MIGIGLKYRMGIGAKAPSLNGIVVSDITDISATISANIITNSYEAAVEIQYGSTPSLGSTLTPAGSPFAKSKDPVAFSVGLTGLLPYSWVFYRIVVTTSKGPVATEIYHFNTLEPVELTDGNWVGMYDANYEKNVIGTPNNNMSELRDMIYDCALSEELNPQPTFDASTGWNVNGTTIVIEDGKLKITGISNFSYAGAYIPVEHRDSSCYHLEIAGMSNIASGFKVRVGYVGAEWVGGASASALPDGDSERDIMYWTSSNNGTIHFINIGGVSGSCEVEGLSVKKILGKHAVYGDSVWYGPVKLSANDYLTFDGSNDRLVIRFITSVGTIYGLVKLTGIDEDFGLINDLSLIGDSSATGIYLGSNAAINAFKAFQMKWLKIRSVTDSAEVIAKLNEWFSRESHELPELFNGILGTGIWNDAAIHDDAAIPVTI